MGKKHASQYANFGSLPPFVHIRIAYNNDVKSTAYSPVKNLPDFISENEAKHFPSV